MDADAALIEEVSMHIPVPMLGDATWYCGYDLDSEGHLTCT